jgi:threonyl-tRNA synthetase
LATNQVDFAIPKRFDLVYVDENNEEQTPLCIHRAPLGTHERFIGFLIEHFGGDFPLWLAPKQVVILPISDKYLDYTKTIEKQLLGNNIRVYVDSRSEKVGAKIRDAELKKIPVMLIAGEKEESNCTASVRRRHKGDLGAKSIKELIPELTEEINKRRRH